MSKNFTVKLERVVGQIKFRPTLATLGGAPRILNDLEESFEEWSSEGNNVTLFTPTKKEFLQTTPDSITVGKESDTSRRQELISYVDQVFTSSLTAFNIKTMHRIGFRTTLILKSNFNYTELVDLIYKKFYSINDRLNEISANEKIKDVVYILVGESNGLANRVHVGPTTSQESMDNFKPNFATKVTLAESNLFVDIDVYTTDVTMEDTAETFKRASEENNRIYNELLNYLEEALWA